MAQLVVSWSIYDGAIRVHAVNAVGRRKGRIIEVEVVDTGETFHGSARRLERLVQTLRRSEGETNHVLAWTLTRPLEPSRQGIVQGCGGRARVEHRPRPAVIATSICPTVSQGGSNIGPVQR
jgi:hypothetical protein